MTEYIKPFLIGGSVIAGSKYVSKFASPAVASLVGGMPTGIIASFFITGAASKKQFFHGYMFNAFVLFLSIVLIHNLLKYTNMNADLVCFIGLVSWAIISYATLYEFGLTKKS